MSQSPERVKDLEPPDGLEDLIGGRSEASIRRQISSLYFSIINYWGAILLYKHGLDAESLYLKHVFPAQIDSEKKSQLKLYPDNFRIIDLESELRTALNYRLNPEIEKVSRLRVACDHRLNNPATIKVNKRIGISSPDLLEVNETRLEQAKVAFKKIIEEINLVENIS